jgi:hypothetical protein
MNVRRIFAPIALVLGCVLPLHAQWADSPSVTGAIYYNGGRVGIGTNAPQSLLHLAGPAGVSTLTFNSPGVQRFRFGTQAGLQNWGALTINSRYESGWYLDDTAVNGWFLKLDGRGGNTANVSNGLWLYRIPEGTNPRSGEAPLFGVTNGRAYFAHNVGIGTTVGTAPAARLHVAGNGYFTGSVTVDGNLAAKYQDIAEWVPSSEILTPGTVVIVDPAAHNGVVSSNSSYQTSVAGVVSVQPGLVLGEAGDSKAMIATTGRVKVRVDATKGAILPGDLLVTSDEPGTAMKSQAIDFGGIEIHRPGTIVGKALEPLTEGKGEILVLLSLQ